VLRDFYRREPQLCPARIALNPGQREPAARSVPTLTAVAAFPAPHVFLHSPVPGQPRQRCLIVAASSGQQRDRNWVTVRLSTKAVGTAGWRASFVTGVLRQGWLSTRNRNSAAPLIIRCRQTYEPESRHITTPVDKPGWKSMCTAGEASSELSARRMVFRAGARTACECSLAGQRRTHHRGPSSCRARNQAVYCSCHRRGASFALF